MSGELNGGEMKNRDDLLLALTEAHRPFFDTCEINPGSGITGLRPEWKFATFPYVGSAYGSAMKILFVGMDIGADEYPGKIGSYEQRRESIEVRERYNPHIG